MELVFENWGLISYKEALDRQLKYVEEVSSDQRSETLILCTHPPVVTLGRATEAGDVTTWDGEIVEVSRGGRATYHGPEQIVIYPILKLERFNKDIHKYLRALENAVIAYLKDLGLEAHAKSGATGIWVGEKKVGSIGIAVKKWVSYHGLALSLESHPNAFSGINPCGFSPSVMTSLEELLSKKLERESQSLQLLKTLSHCFSRI